MHKYRLLDIAVGSKYTFFFLMELECIKIITNLNCSYCRIYKLWRDIFASMHNKSFIYRIYIYRIT